MTKLGTTGKLVLRKEETRENIVEAIELYLRPSKEELSENAKVFEVAI